MAQTTARAKVNLALHVTGQKPAGSRHAGYHTLSSLVAFADYGDDIVIERAKTDRLTVDGPFAQGVPPLEHNSLGHALHMVRRWAMDDRVNGPVRIHLRKKLPIASGIGGGSADAAALITLTTEGRRLTAEQMSDCLALGADVPMCLSGTPALVDGIGEKNRPISLPPFWLVLVNPGVEVSTPAIFKALKKRNNPPLAPWQNTMDFTALTEYLKTTRNDLMKPAIALEPSIGAVLKALSQAPFASMSGSGATCFALLGNKEEAQALAQQISNTHPSWWVQAAKIAQ